MAGPIRITVLVVAEQAKREFKEIAKSADKLDGDLKKSGEKVGKSFLSGFATSTSGIAKILPEVLQGIASNPIGLAAIVGAGLAVAGLLAATITAALGLALGGFFLGLGAFALRKSKPLKDAMKGLGDDVSKSLAKAAEPLEGPLLKGIQTLRDETKKLSPIFSEIFGGLATTIQPLAKGVGELLEGFLGGVKKALPGIVGVVETFAGRMGDIGKALGTMVSTIFQNSGVAKRATDLVVNVIDGLLKGLGGLIFGLTVGFEGTVNLFLLLKDSIGDASTAIGGFLKNNEGIAAIVEKWKPLKTAITDVLHAFTEFAAAPDKAGREAAFGKLIDKIKALWEPLKEFFKTVFQVAWDAVMAFWQNTVQPWITGTVLPFLEKQLKAGVKAIFSAMVDEVTAQLASLPGKAAGALASLASSILTRVTDAARQALTAAGKLVVDVVQSLATLPGKAATAVSTLWGKMTSAFSTAKTNAVAAATSLVSSVVSFLASLPGKAGSALASLWSSISSAFTTAVSNAKTAASNLVSGFISIVTGLPGKAGKALAGAKSAVTGAFSGAGGWLADAGAKIIQGLIDGIRSRLGGITDIMNKAADLARGAWPFSPPKYGPLKKHPMKKAGQNIITELTSGIDSKAASIVTSSSAAAGQVVTGTGAIPSANGGMTSTGVGGVVINFNGVVGDPLAVGKQIDAVMQKYVRGTGKKVSFA